MVPTRRFSCLRFCSGSAPSYEVLLVCSPQTPDSSPTPKSAEEVPTVKSTAMIMDKLADVTTIPFPRASRSTSDAAFRPLGLSCRDA